MKTPRASYLYYSRSDETILTLRNADLVYAVDLDDAVARPGDLLIVEGVSANEVTLIVRMSPKKPVVVLQKEYDAEVAAELIRAGAQDVLSPGNPDLEQALFHATLRPRTGTSGSSSESFLRIAQRLGAAVSVDEMGRILARGSRDLFQHDAFTFCLYSEDTETRTGIYAEDTMSDAKKPAKVDARPLDRTYRTDEARATLFRKPKLINRDQHPEHSEFSLFGDKTRLARSLLFAPILWEGELIGQIGVQSYTPNRFGEPELERLRSLGDLSGAALVRVRTGEALLRAEKQMRTSQKMEAIGRLAGGVAHDFNNMLSAIIGFSQLGLQKIEKDHPLESPLKEIKTAGERAATLTSQLLAISRRQMLAPTVMDLNVVITELQEMLRSLIGEGIELQPVLTPGPARIKADRSQIEQVILNLVINARDAMPRGGRILIGTTLADSDAANTMEISNIGLAAYVVLEVTDTGSGMDEETLTHMYEPFFTTKKARGTGLGLSTVYGIVKQSGGSIRVKSIPGKGTSFSICLPATEEEGPTHRTTRAIRIKRGEGTILLVEDEDLVRSLARQVLERAGYRVIEAVCGDDALKQSGGHSGTIHLMLTDVVMPNLNGPQVAEKLSGLRPKMKVMYMSGYADEVIGKHGVPDDGMPFLQKPFTPDRLVRTVQLALEQE